MEHNIINGKLRYWPIDVVQVFRNKFGCLFLRVQMACEIVHYLEFLKYCSIIPLTFKQHFLSELMFYKQ